MKSAGMNNVASWISDSTLETVESLRWPCRMSRSEFIRRALQHYIDSIKEGLKADRGQRGKKRGLR